MKQITLVLAAMLAVALLAVVSCGGGDDPTPTPAKPAGTVDPNATASPRATRAPISASAGAAVQPCSLIGTDQIQPIIGSITTVTPTAGECKYTGDTGMLTVHVEKAASTDAATAKLTEIVGVSAEAASVADGGFYVNNAEIAARKGVYVFTLSLTKDAKDALLSLAQTTAVNLPSS